MFPCERRIVREKIVTHPYCYLQYCIKNHVTNMQEYVHFRTSKDREGYWNLLTHQNLRRVGINNWREIERIEPFFHVPGTLYVEPSVPDTRPYGGSLGVWLYTATQRASIQDIINYDYNVDRDHNCGLPHWNHDRRFIDIHGNIDDNVRADEYHIIEASPEITLTFFKETKTIRRD